MTIIMPGF